MEIIDFKKSLKEDCPPANYSLALKALWFAANDNWEASHDIAQDMHNTMGSWIHAYLHRAEGDDFNAGYWYRQAGKTFPEVALKEELQSIVEAVIA
ncbi:hypothetical protein [uncultured Maribacter sp.]|uniref:hypothetical protein n=1 Tax=uncultured Maribacter sp. TaxID=431308 RepID=UPI002635BF1D|nr:hypothetical protein [uncultured Maribacter sp.]